MEPGVRRSSFDSSTAITPSITTTATIPTVETRDQRTPSNNFSSFTAEPTTPTEEHQPVQSFSYDDEDVARSISAQHTQQHKQHHHQQQQQQHDQSHLYHSPQELHPRPHHHHPQNHNRLSHSIDEDLIQHLDPNHDPDHHQHYVTTNNPLQHQQQHQHSNTSFQFAKHSDSGSLNGDRDKGDSLSNTLSNHTASPIMQRRGSIHSRTSVLSHGSFGTRNQDTISLKSRTSLRSRSPEPTIGGVDTTSSRSISFHRRSPSNQSIHSIISYTSTDKMPQEPSVPTLYLNSPRKGLTCMICASVFADPVLGSCGHTFCRKCIQSLPSGGGCPSSQHRGIKLAKTNLTSNITIVEELAELEIYCKYGLTSVAGGGYVLNQEGCQQMITQGSRQDHESTCPHRLENCPHSYACGQIKTKEMQAHLESCPNFSCAHKPRGCKFTGTKQGLLLHLNSCKYELVKGFLQESDARIQSLSETLEVKDQEIEFLKAMLAKLSEKVESMEANFDQRLVNLGGVVEQLHVDVSENSREIGDVRDEFGNLQEQLDVDDRRVLKCVGTFVGHQGPVWALAAHENFLFSGSSDETVKVWDTKSKQAFTNVKTLKGHRGIVHALATHANILYSGSHDCTINIWDIQTYELIDTLVGHDNPVCTLAIANDMLFSGSLKVVNIWDLRTNTLAGSLTGFNHWVRALVTTDEYLFAGSYQVVSIWSSAAKDVLPTLKEGREPQCLEQLKTSGGSIYSVMLTDKYIIAGTYEHLIHIWDGKTLELVNTLEGHAGTVYALDVMTRSKGGTRLFSASYDRTIRVWDLDTFACLQVLARHDNSVDALAVQKKWVFSGAADSNIKVWQY